MSAPAFVFTDHIYSRELALYRPHECYSIPLGGPDRR